MASEIIFRDFYDVVNIMIDRGPYTRQQLAHLLKPDCDTGYPESWLAKATHRGNNIGFTPAEIDLLIEYTEGAPIMAQYLKQKHGTSIPPRELVVEQKGKRLVATLHYKKQRA